MTGPVAGHAKEQDRGHPDVPVLLTVGEACAALRISRWTFYRLVQQRQLQTVKILSRRLVPAESLRRFLAALPAREQM